MFSLYDLVPKALPEPIRAGIVRGVRTAIALVLAGVTTAIADGSLLNAIKVIPPEYAVMATGVLSSIFMAVDKWLRDRGLVEDLKAEEADPTVVDTL